MVVIGAALAVMVMVQAFELVAVMTQGNAVFISSASPLFTLTTDEPGSAEVQHQVGKARGKGPRSAIERRVKNSRFN